MHMRQFLSMEISSRVILFCVLSIIFVTDSSFAVRKQPQLLYSRPVVIDGVRVGQVDIFEGQEPADVAHQFTKQNNLTSVVKNAILKDACNQVLCTRVEAVVFSKVVKNKKNVIVGTLDVLEGQECADSAYTYCKAHGLEVEIRNRIVTECCEAIKCSRREAVVFRKAFRTDTEELGELVVYEGREPADVVYEFGKERALSSDVRLAMVENVCAALPYTCTRLQPVVYKKTISDHFHHVGTITILEGEEPVDVIYKFGQHHGLSDERRKGIVHDVCGEITCNRVEAIIYSKPVSRENGVMVGVVTIHESEEPVDAIHKFCLMHSLNEDFRMAILRDCCSQVTCKRAQPIVYKQVIALENGTDAGNLTIYDGQEPADVIFQFCEEHALGRKIFNNLLRTVCYAVPCTRAIPVVFSLPISGPENQHIGVLEIKEDEEPVDVVHKFFMSHGMARAGWSRGPIMDRVCDSKHLQCNRTRALALAINLTSEEGSSIGELKIWEEDEAADAIYKFGKEHNLTKYQRWSLLSNICSKQVGLCQRSDPVIYSMEVSKDHPYVCPSYRAGWRFIAPNTRWYNSWDLPTEKLQPIIQNTTNTDPYLNHEAFEIWFYFIISMFLLPYSVLSVTKVENHMWPQVSRQRIIQKSLIITATLGLVIWWIMLGGTTFIYPESEIDHAMWKDKVIDELVVYEGQEPVDAAYEFCLKQYLKEIMRTKLHEEIVTHLCNETTTLNCTRMRPREVMVKGELTQYGIKYNIKYQRPQNETACEPLDVGLGTTCTLEAAQAVCERLNPAPSDCLWSMLQFIDSELQNYDKKRWKGKTDHYKALALLKDATDAEVDIAYRRLAPQFGGVVSPYRPPYNRTGPHYWLEKSKKLWRVKSAFETLGDLKEREFYDKPCEPIFGGAMCARKMSDGGLQILVDNAEED